MSEENLARLAELGGKDVTETFTYTVIDGHGGASQGSITVTLKVPDGVSVVPVEPSEPEPSMPGTGNGDEHAGGDGLHNTDGSTTDQPGGTDNTDEGVHGTGNVSDGDGINGVGAHDAHGLDDGGNMPLNTGLLSRYGRGSMFGTDNLNNLDGDGADGLPHMDDGNTSGVEGLAAHAPSHALGTDDLAAHDWDANETDAGNGAANVAPAHAPLAFSGDGNADQLLGASPFTADDFGIRTSSATRRRKSSPLRRTRKASTATSAASRKPGSFSKRPTTPLTACSPRPTRSRKARPTLA